MRRIFMAFFALAIALLLLANCQLFAQGKVETSPNLPPLDGTYISPQLWHQLYALGIVIKDVKHNRFLSNQPPPPPGGTQVHAFNSTVSMQVSTNGGMTFDPANANASVQVLVHSTTDDPDGTRHFDTEMLALNISGGSFMVRESPTLQSTGKTTITLPPGGLYHIDSFFDIFTELSVNGGATWMPGQNGPTHMVLQGDPPVLVTTSPNLPPLKGVYRNPFQPHQYYANGATLRGPSHKIFTHNDPPPPPGENSTHSFGSMVDCEVSTDGGMTFSPFSAPAQVTVKVTSTVDDPDGTRHFDTEMLQLDLSGGTVMVRESPTLASTGKTTIKSLPDGTYHIDSFFDIFTELSMDGGMSWSPSTGSGHMELQPDPPPITTTDPNLPPIPGRYVSPAQWHASFAQGIVIRNVSHDKFTGNQTPPALGSSQTHTFNSQVRMDVSVDGGMTWYPYSAPAQAMVQVAHTMDDGPRRMYDTEMLQLDISGGTLPMGVRIRESPTLASTGRTVIEPLPGGQYRLGSFFDIFVEVSIDDGQNYSPATSAGHMELVTAPPIEVDQFPSSIAQVTIQKPGGTEVVILVGPTTVEVETDASGHASDPDGDGLDQVRTEMTAMSLSGNSSMGPVNAHLRPGMRALGEIEEDVNNNSGTLDIPPFAPAGTAKSFFDIFPELQVGGLTLHTAQPVHMASTIRHKPPANGDQYINPFTQPVDLLDQNGNPTGVKLVSEIHEPNPPYEYDVFPNSAAQVTLQYPSGQTEVINLSGPTRVTVCIPPDGRAADTDGNGLDQVKTEMTQLDLTGDSPTLGPVQVSLNPLMKTLGGIEETANNNPGTLGLPPFEPTGMASSFFDVFFEIDAGGRKYHTPQPAHMTSTIHHKPPAPGDEYVNPFTQQLLDENGNPTGITIINEVHIPNPPTANGSICGMKWEDKNGNGIKDAGEPGLSGWKIKATDVATGVVYSAVTDPAGNYCFTDLTPGTYKVEEVLQAGWMQTGGQPYYTVTVSSGQIVNGIDFGNFRNGAIYGMKFNDLNGNGVKDPDEPGLPGWTICLTRNQPPPSPVFPTTGGTDFLGTTMATVNINLYPAYSGLNVTMCASGNTTVQRANPSGPTPNDSMQTEITTLEMTGFLPPTLPNDKFIIRHVKDRRSYGSIQGNNFPAISDFDVYFEVVMPASLGGGTYVNYTATNMSAGPGITTIPPGGQNYLGFNTYLVNKNNPLDTLGLIKTVNHCVLGGAQAGTQHCDCPSKSPPNLLPPGAPVGTACVVTDANGNYCFMDLPAGSYNLTEMAQAGWIQTTPNPPKIVIGSGQTVTGVDFGNKNTDVQLCIFKYYDANHNNQRDPSEGGLPAGICFDITQSGNPVGIICTDATSTACITLPPGIYTIMEQVPPGYSSSDPKGGVRDIDLVGGQDVTIDWGNAAGLTDSSFRTATMEEWAQARDPKSKLKSIKCKPIAVDFKVNLTIPNNPVIPTKVHFKFSVPVDKIVVSLNKDKQAVLTCAVGTPKDPLKPVEWTVDLSNCGLPPGTLLQFDCHGTKGALPKVHYDWLSTAGTILVKGDLAPLRKGGVVGDTLKNVYLRLPMPNLVNVGEDLQHKQGYFPFTTGAATGSSSVIYLKYNDVQKSLVKAGKTPQEDILHTHPERPLDYFDDRNGVPVTTKPILKQQKSLPPVKHNNRLYAEALALQLNIMASQGAQFPVGFGDLIWDDHKNTVCGTDLFNGKSVKEIMQQINQFLIAGGANPKPGLTAYNYWCVAWYLNHAFAGCALDTVSWGCVKVKMTGCIRLKDVLYLRAPAPGSVPEFTEPAGSNAQYVPDQYELSQNYPNPFNPTTTISFELPTTSVVSLEIFNTLGQKVGTLIDREELEDGVQEVEFDASALSSGIYFYKLTATSMTEDENGNFSAGETHVILKKMMLIK